MAFFSSLWYTVLVRKSKPDDPKPPCSHLTGAAPAFAGAPRTKFSEAVPGLVTAARKGGFCFAPCKNPPRLL